jgi:hypothetical protein
MPNKVLASRFNALKARVDNILGPAEETNRTAANNGYSYGYGQALGSGVDQTTSNDTIDALNYKLLYINIIKIRYHQVGTTGFSPLDFVTGDFLTNLANTDKVEEAYIQGLESLATNMETDRLALHPSQAEITVCDTSNSAVAPWNGTLSHIFKVTFSSAQARREYFNSGGKIRFNPSMTYTGTQSKTLDWKNMLDAIGNVDFGFNSTISSTGYGQSYGGIGHDYMSNSYQTAYYGSGGGVYNPNRYTIYAMELSDSVLQFKCEFSDPSYGQPDENVLADVLNSTLFVRANGLATIDGAQTTTVSVPEPFSTTVSGL